MRRKDREITEFTEIIDVLRRADTVRVGMFNGEYPYIVPVSFGMEIQEGSVNTIKNHDQDGSADTNKAEAAEEAAIGSAGKKVIIYFHSAQEGLKNQCIAANSKVCVESDIFHMIQKTDVGITTRFESVIGFGDIEEVFGEEKIAGLCRIMEHYGYPEYPVDRCKGLPKTVVFKITVDQITGKRNLPE